MEPHRGWDDLASQRPAEPIVGCVPPMIVQSGDERSHRVRFGAGRIQMERA
jgi:hypothetical protein